MGDFAYTPEWYATDSVALWLPKVKCVDDLIFLYTSETIHPAVKKRARFKRQFGGYDSLGGRLLELGFNSGFTMYWLSQKYPNLTIDGLDFNYALEPIISLIKEAVPGVKDLWIGNVRKIDKPDNYYDYITSLDFFEHLPETVYEETLLECKRLLKPGGLIWVYFGKPKQAEHINIREDKIVIEDFERVGFGFVDSNDGLIFRNDKGVI